MKENGADKLIVIGIDGGSWDYIDPLLEKGRMPNLRYMIERGCRGILQSTVPPLTPPAWSSFITGKLPCKHGIFDFFVYENGAVKIMNAANRKGLPFWKYLDHRGIRAGVCGVPFVYPQEPVDGFLICGFDTPEDAQIKTYPPELAVRLEDKYGRYFFHEPPLQMLSDSEDGLFINLCQEQSQSQTEAFIDLIEEYKVSVALINYMLFDHFNHYMKEYSFVEEALVTIDQNIGKLLNKFPQANFIILSDHGSCRLNTLFLIEDWLEEKGWLIFNRKQVQRTKLNRTLASIFQDKWRWKGTSEKIIRNGMVRVIELMPSGLQSSVVDLCARIHRAPISYWKGDARDLENSMILATSYGLYLNLPNGVSSPKDPGEKYNQVRESLISELLTIRDPMTGLPFFFGVYRKEEVYSGESLSKAPDIITLPNPNCGMIHGAVIQEDAFLSPFFVKSDAIAHYGGHINEGIFVFYGNDFSKYAPQGLNIVDIPAIILYLCGVPIPDDFDGAVAKDVFHPAFLKTNPVKHQEAMRDTHSHEGLLREENDYEDDQEDKVKQRLRDLGYM